MSNDFIHLHLHTEYSLRDAITPPEGLMKKCADVGMKKVAVTDHGNLMGIPNCAKYAKKYGVQLIPGNEVYLVPDVEACRGREWIRGKSSHLVLLAMDDKGWENLKILTTRSNSQGFYFEPRIDYQMLEEHGEGLIALTACLGGVLAKPWFKDQPLALVADRLKSIMGDRIFFEIQLNGREEQINYNDAVIKLAQETGTQLVATVDSHYLEKTDSHKQDLVFALGMGKQLKDPDRHRYPAEMHSVETPDQVLSRFMDRYGEIGRRAVLNTSYISDNCSANVEIESKDYKIPSVPVAEAEDYEDFINWKRTKIAKFFFQD